mgnify:CR=1 FL=1
MIRRAESDFPETLFMQKWQTAEICSRLVQKRRQVFSITKTVLALLINSVLLVAIILGTARWYKKRTPDSPAPKGFVGFMEMFVMMIEDDVIKGGVGKDYKRYSPFLLTAFFFVFINNLMGLIPIFPGGANVTGNIAICLLYTSDAADD